MISVGQVDRLVVADDAVAARLWPRLGPRVRQAYTADRDAWIVLRRKVDAGETLPASTLAAQHRAFSGWSRAFRAASTRPKRARVSAHAAPAPVAAAAAARVPSPPIAPPLAAPGAQLPSIPKPTGVAGAAVAGGLVLAGLVAVAARRKHA